MRCVAKNFLTTGPDFSLSPEHWLALETSGKMGAGTPFSDLVTSISRQVTPPPGARFVLDTGHARDGVLDLPILGDPTSERTSAKKLALEGDVIVSRLRPYLRQVALLPKGLSGLLEQGEFYCSTEFLVFRPKDPTTAAGLVAWLLSDSIQNMMSEAATGGHHPRIGPELLLSARVADEFLDPARASALSDIFTRHVEGLRKLSVLLRH